MRYTNNKLLLNTFITYIIVPAQLHIHCYNWFYYVYRRDNYDLTAKLYIDDYNKITLINNRKNIN